MKINLNNHTELEQKFLVAAEAEYNDLMFTDELNHGIEKASLSGVVSSLVKKGIIEVYESPALNGHGTRNIGEFQFTDDNEKPELVRE